MLAEIVLEETARALKNKLRFPDSVVALDLAVLRRHPVHPTALPPEESPLSKPDDAQILASALAVGAEVLVTGDRDILDVRDRIHGIVVKNPREFWEMVRGRG
jgi:predicted nucleic acid-binding protein